MRCFRITVHVSQTLRHGTGCPLCVDWVSMQRWGPSALWAEPPRHVPARRHLRRSSPQVCEAWRSSNRTAQEIRADHQPEDRQGSRPHHPAVPARASRRDHLVMDRRAFIVMVGASVLATSIVARAQQAVKTARISYLAGNLATGPSFSDAFRQGLRDLGYVEGRDVVIEFQDAQGKAERLPALAAELVARKVDLILAPGTQHAMAAKQATMTF